VPWEHDPQDRLPAVSGSSGHLVIAHRPSPRRFWPGQAFAQLDLPFEVAMQRYAAGTRDRLVRGKVAPRLPEQEKSAWRAEWEARAERHQVRQQRRQEDVDWRAERAAHKRIVDAYRAGSRKARAAQAAEWEAQMAHWAQREQARQAVRDQRQVENQRWHERNRTRRQKAETAWIAILVVTDNATRQCLGLPVFASGAHVTAAEITAALQNLLPPQLAFLIHDQGAHFRSKLLAQLAHTAGFVQIPIYRHRPQTNGIAERFVRTLKHDLAACRWSGPEELKGLLEEIHPDYNDRPHQGLAIPGLSPNEFANRIWLM
jgi:transposase InsO family protein